MMNINSATDIATAIIANGPLSDLWAAGLSRICVDAIREMDHPAYGTDWEDWVGEHADEIREETARRDRQSISVDLVGLARDGYLDLQAAFDGVDDREWAQIGPAATYVLRGFGPNNSPGTIEIYIQSAMVYGIRAYRWEEVEGDHSAPYLSESEALAAAQAYAADCDESDDNCAAALAYAAAYDGSDDESDDD